jgi:hypothetical protein
LRGWIAPAYEVLAHAGFADVDAQLEQFPMDARRSRGSSCESVAESLWTLVDARVGHDELSRSRTTESRCDASQ